MSTTTAADTAPASALTGEPQWLALNPEPVYAVLHTPPPQVLTGHAALLLPAFGWDDECSYRRRRAWATELASAGITTARFDFPGRENSAGSPLAQGLLESWVTASVEAARWLCERSGCERLTAIGIGVGGLIAYRAAIEDAPIDDLVLWGVRSSGRAYVRELRAYAAITAGAEAVEGRRMDGAIGIGGHIMSEETAQAIGAVELAQLTLPAAGKRRVLLIGRDRHGFDTKLREHLAESGAELTLLESGEYHALMSPPDLGLSPTDTVSASVAWIAASATGRSGPTRRFHETTHVAATSSVTFEHDGVLIRERLTTLQTAEGMLRGVISEPAVASGATCCLVTVNSGALRHTGPNRMFVEVGRRAAASGVPAARFDLPGLGDSDGTAIRSFERTDADDRASLALLGAIYDHLEQLGVATSFVAAGFSLGGYLTVRVATTDSRVVGALCVNPTGFVWTGKQRERVLKDLIALVGPEALAAEPEASRMPRLLRPLSKRLARERRGLDAKLRRWLARSDLLWRIEHRRELTGLSDRLDELADAEIPMLLLLSRNEQLLRMLERPAAVAKLERCPGIRIERLPDDDHLLRPLAIQEIVAERFVSALVDFSSATGLAATETPGDPSVWELRGVNDAKRSSR